MGTRDHIPPPQFVNARHVGELIDETGSEQNRSGPPSLATLAEHLEAVALLDPDDAIALQRHVVAGQGCPAVVKQSGRSRPVLAEEVVYMRGRSVPGSPVVDHDDPATSPAERER